MTGRSGSFVLKNTSTSVTNAPGSSTIENDCAKGSLPLLRGGLGGRGGRGGRGGLGGLGGRGGGAGRGLGGLGLGAEGLGLGVVAADGDELYS